MPFRKLSLSLAQGPAALDTILSLTWLLVCVLVIIVLAYLFTKYAAGRGIGFLGTGSGTDQFKVLTRLSLGREQSLALVQAGGRYLLLGVTPSEVSLVAELTQEEAQVLYTRPASDQPAPPSFGEALRSVLQQKKPR